MLAPRPSRAWAPGLGVQSDFLATSLLVFFFFRSPTQTFPVFRRNHFLSLKHTHLAFGK